MIDRYPRGFADADHLSFTSGIHVCLGAHLARALIDVYLEHMAERVGTIEITGPVVRSANALGPRDRRPPCRVDPERSLTQFFANLLGSSVEPVVWAASAEPRVGTALA